MNVASHHSRSGTSGLWWWLRQILSWTYSLAIVGLLAVMVVIPQLFGSGSYTVLTGSMRPEMPPGSLVVTKEADPDELRIGEAITYQVRSGEPEVITHRIVARTSSNDGVTFTTQGDASPSPDENQVRPEQIRGVVWYTLPFVGYVNVWLTGEQRMWIIGGSVVLLVAYTITMFVSAFIERRRKGRSQVPTGHMVGGSV